MPRASHPQIRIFDGERAGAVRVPKSIRFTESEWDAITETARASRVELESPRLMRPALLALLLLTLTLTACDDADPTGPVGTRTRTCTDRPVGSPVASTCQ